MMPARAHFIDKERDPESGLDNFGARYIQDCVRHTLRLGGPVGGQLARFAGAEEK